VEDKTGILNLAEQMSTVLIQRLAGSLTSHRSPEFQERHRQHLLNCAQLMPGMNDTELNNLVMNIAQVGMDQAKNLLTTRSQRSLEITENSMKTRFGPSQWPLR
jgi:hypothetical protein